MAENTTPVELVAFHQTGLEDIETRLKAFGDTVTKAGERNRALSKSLSDGTYYRASRQVAVLNREYERLQNTAKLQQLVAEHGKLGGWLRANESGFRRFGTTAAIGYGIAAGGIMGLVRSGLQGTVQGYQMELAWQRLGRSVAGIALPAIEKITGWVDRLDRFLSRLSDSQKDTILNFGLLAGGALVFGGALRTVFGIGSAAVGMLKSMGAVSAISGFTSGGIASTGAVAARTAAASGLGSAITGAGATVAGGTAAAAATRAATARGAGAATAAATAAPRAATGMGAAGIAALAAIPLYGATQERAVQKTGLEGWSSQKLKQAAAMARQQETWAHRFRHNLTELTVGNSADALVSMGLLSSRKDFRSASTRFESMAADSKTREEEDKKRGVDMLPSGFNDIGAGFFRIQEEVLKATSRTTVDANTGERTAATLQQISEKMDQIMRGDYTPPPPKAGS